MPVRTCMAHSLVIEHAFKSQTFMPHNKPIDPPQDNLSSALSPRWVYIRVLRHRWGREIIDAEIPSRTLGPSKKTDNTQILVKQIMKTRKKDSKSCRDVHSSRRSLGIRHAKTESMYPTIKSMSCKKPGKMMIRALPAPAFSRHSKQAPRAYIDSLSPVSKIKVSKQSL